MFGEIKNAQGERLDYSFSPGSETSKNIVVIGHGVTGNKDRPFILALEQGLARSGIASLRFSFSGNGASGGDFMDSTISKEVEDLDVVLNALNNHAVCYIGHSMGGAVGVLHASCKKGIKFLVSLAGMVHTKAFARREFGMLTPGAGYMWDEPGCPLSKAYMDDMARLDTLVDCAKQITVPWLLVHGTADDVVPIQDSHDIFAKAGQPKQLIEIEGSNHVFGGEFTPIMVEKVVAWLKPRIG